MCVPSLRQSAATLRHTFVGSCSLETTTRERISLTSSLAFPRRIEERVSVSGRQDSRHTIAADGAMTEGSPNLSLNFSSSQHIALTKVEPCSVLGRARNFSDE